MVPFFRFPMIGVSYDSKRQYWERTQEQVVTPAKGGKLGKFLKFASSRPSTSTSGKSQVDLEFGQVTMPEFKWKTKPRSDPLNVSTYAAGWANLLDCFSNSLSLFESYNPVLEAKSLLFCDTEYLPGDVCAAPAAGNIETIVTMAMLAGCDTIKLRGENGFPSAHASNMQLTFQTHPQLGTIAVFRKFPGTETYYQYVKLPHRLEGMILLMVT
jgi:hypothetical protein